MEQAQNGRGSLDILISNASALPIYEQITQQIKDAILSGRLEEGTLLPGIRSLANELHVSVITTKRAYADLEEAGFVTSVQGKGTYVAGGNLEMLREEHLRSWKSSYLRSSPKQRAQRCRSESCTNCSIC